MEQRLSLFSVVSASILLFFILSVCCSSADGRKDFGAYWKGIMKEEPMPATLEAALTLSDPNPTTSSQSLLKNPNHDAHSTTSGNPASATHDPEVEEMPVAESFEPRPDMTAYGG
uniref:Uncharacterized protein n=1 Tax=Kalanchoe fedtschenkoi TaxID=63787 RepID=A0A7N0VCI5_KALFE